MAKLIKPFEFTVPFTTQRKDSEGNLRPEHSGDLYIKGISSYDKEAPPEYSLNYDLQQCSFTPKGAPQEMPMSEWAGGTMMNLQDAHMVIIGHLKKIFHLETGTEATVNVVHISRDRTEGIIHTYYKDSDGIRQEMDIEEPQFEEWIRAKGISQSLRQYWPAYSTGAKSKHLAEYITENLLTATSMLSADANTVMV